jgi:hypothetical protein
MDPDRSKFQIHMGRKLTLDLDTDQICSPDTYLGKFHQSSPSLYFAKDLPASVLCSTMDVVRSRRARTTFVREAGRDTAKLGIYTLLLVNPARRAVGGACYPHHLMEQAGCEN